jgi:AraC-like DNA-binding protein
VSVAGVADCSSLLRRLAPFLGDTAHHPRPGVLPVPMLVSAGVERQGDPHRYRWDGLRRGHDVKCPQGVPHAIVQYTLAGCGRYADRDGERAVPAGHAFIALVPSPHRYWLPAGGAPWTFCWFAVAHEAIVARLRLQVARHGAGFDADPAGALVGRIAEVVAGLFRHSFLDDFALEAALWALVSELDRHHDRRERPPADKHALLDRVRALVMADLAVPLGPADIAHRIGWHRVYFAERFRAVTGLTPGAFITGLRLDEARRLLRGGPATLDQVARAVGLGSASHLCRLFRRIYGGTPGRYRGAR